MARTFLKTKYLKQSFTCLSLERTWKWFMTYKVLYIFSSNFCHPMILLKKGQILLHWSPKKQVKGIISGHVYFCFLQSLNILQMEKNNAIHQYVHLIHITITVFLLSYEVWELCLSRSLCIVSAGKYLVHSSSYLHFLSEIQCNNVLHEYHFCVKFGIGVLLPGKQEETNKMASRRTRW